MRKKKERDPEENKNIKTGIGRYKVVKMFTQNFGGYVLY